MSELSLVLPEVNKPDKTEDPKIVTAFTTVQAWANGNIGGVNVEASLTGLRLIAQADGFLLGSSVNATYFFSGGADLTKATASVVKFLTGPHLVYLTGSDFAITGKTTRLALRADIVTNATAPPTQFVFGLYPVSGIAGSTGELQITFGAAVAGSGITIEPTAGVSDSAIVSFAFPEPKFYAVGFTTNATSNAAAISAISTRLYASNS